MSGHRRTPATSPARPRTASRSGPQRLASPSLAATFEATGPEPQEEILQLQAWGEKIQANITHADNKASILLGLSGAALAFLPTQLGLAGLAWSGLGLVTGALAVTGLGLLGSCAVVLVLAVRPGRAAARPVFGQPMGEPLSTAQIRALVAEARTGVDPEPAAARISLLRAIATRKHQRVRLATTLLLASVVPLVLSLVMRAVA
jgi:hypothetical protein